MKITVSHDTFAEIEAAMAKQNVTINQNSTALTLEKGSQIEPPVNYKMVTIRRDCADIAAKSYNVVEHGDFIVYVNRLYNFIMNEKIETGKPTANRPTSNKQTGGWD